jgi:dihydroxyacetone kinase-like protein
MERNIGHKEIDTMFGGAIEKVRANIDELSALDSATGDGDHGTAMNKAMNAIEKALEESGDSGLKDLLYNIGWAVMCIDGGSTGPLLGSLFMGMSESVSDATELDCSLLAAMFEGGLGGVQKQSKAQIGDKTMMDALDPAVAAIRKACDAGKTIPAALSEGADAGEKGALATKDFVAKFGRAKNLGERSLGHQDPGATSISMIFRGFAEALA